jgi:tRNA-dihydrouridine synthase A
MEALVPYAERHLKAGGRLNNIARHILGLYHGRPRARQFRRYLAENAPAAHAAAQVLSEATRLVEDGIETAPLAAAE